MDVLVMNMRVGLHIFKASSQLVFEDESKCFFVDEIDETIKEALFAILSNDSMGTCLSQGYLRLFDLACIMDEMDSTLDSTPHLESSS